MLAMAITASAVAAVVPSLECHSHLKGEQGILNSLVSRGREHCPYV